MKSTIQSVHTTDRGFYTQYTSGKSAFIPFEEPIVIKRIRRVAEPKEYELFSLEENRLYNIARHGLGGISQQELSLSHPSKLVGIQQFHRRCQVFLNQLKNQILEEKFEHIASKLGNGCIVRAFRIKCTPEYNLLNRLSFSQLGITKKQIINHLKKNLNNGKQI